MVSKAINEGLLTRIQTYVARDINSRKAQSSVDDNVAVLPEDVYILNFSRILTNWQAVAAIQDASAGFYVINYSGQTEEAIASIYQLHSTHEAII